MANLGANNQDVNIADTLVVVKTSGWPAECSSDDRRCGNASPQRPRWPGVGKTTITLLLLTCLQRRRNDLQKVCTKRYCVKWSFVVYFKSVAISTKTSFCYTNHLFWIDSNQSQTLLLRCPVGAFTHAQTVNVACTKKREVNV